MGLKAPENTLAYPEDYITALAKLNGGKVTKPNPAPVRPATASVKPATVSTKPAAPKPAAANPKPQASATPVTPQTASTPAAASDAQAVR
jgi:hypothetical protein